MVTGSTAVAELAWHDSVRLAAGMSSSLPTKQLVDGGKRSAESLSTGGGLDLPKWMIVSGDARHP
jgi:hypothetical protein